jgi:hypothetical protein
VPYAAVRPFSAVRPAPSGPCHDSATSIAVLPAAGSGTVSAASDSWSFRAAANPLAETSGAMARVKRTGIGVGEVRGAAASALDLGPGPVIWLESEAVSEAVKAPGRSWCPTPSGDGRRSRPSARAAASTVERGHARHVERVSAPASFGSLGHCRPRRARKRIWRGGCDRPNLERASGAVSLAARSRPGGVGARPADLPQSRRVLRGNRSPWRR